MIYSFVYDKDLLSFELIDNNDINMDNFVSPVFYDCFEFHNYHQKFTDKLFKLFIKSKGKYIGYCYLGQREDVLKAPYSSPFSLVYLKKNYKIKDVIYFVKGIKEFAKYLKLNKVQITLPPEIYSVELINTLSATFFSEGFKVLSIDINNYFDFKFYDNKFNYLEKASHKVRKNYKTALKNNLEFVDIDNNDFHMVYDVIKVNREQMGYPLKISKEQMQDLINMNNLNVRCFVVKKDNINVAAAIIFDVNEDISQVIYWGDILEYRDERPMELLTTEVFALFSQLGKKYLDIGPSSEDGVINSGLADFKKSIGCSCNLKITFEYVFEER